MSDRVYMVSRDLAHRLAARFAPGSLSPLLQRAVEYFAPEPVRHGAAAVLRIDGAVVMDNDWFHDSIVAVPALQLARKIREIAADASVSTLVLDLDCPGWSSSGSSDVVAAIDEARKTKHVWAIAHDMACSGGMAIGACVERFCCTPTSILGSMGTLMLLYDTSAALAKAGIEPVVVAEPSDDKAAGYPGVAITDATRENLRGIVKDHHDWYAAVLARRGITADTVRDLAAGVFAAKAAVEHGLADEIVPFDAFLAQAAAMPAKRSAAGTSPSVSSTARGGKPAARKETTTMTLDDLKKDHPDLVSAIGDQAVKAAQAAPADFKALNALYGEKDKAFVTECLEQERTLAQASKAWADKAEARALAAEQELADLKAKSLSIGEDPVSANPKAGAAKTLEDAARAIMLEKKCTAAVAMFEAAKANPRLHDEWRRRGSPSLVV